MPPKRARKAADTATAVPVKRAKTTRAGAKMKEDNPPSIAVAPVEKDTCPLEWITTGRSVADYRRQAEADPAYGENEKEVKRLEKESRKYWGRPLSKNPNWPWRASREADEKAMKYANDIEKRDPENFNMYIYNDFGGYGAVEVLENILQDWATEFLKKDKACPWELWKHIEITARFFDIVGSMWGLAMLDDGERGNDLMDLLGLSLVSTLNNLESADLLIPNGPVKDLELILSISFDWMTTYLDQYEFGIRLNQVNAYTEKANIKIDKLYNIQDDVEAYPASELNKKQRDQIKAPPKVDKFNFRTKWNKYVKMHGTKGKVGGNNFDITKMTKAQRKQYAFDGKDPLEGMEVPDGDGSSAFLDFEWE